MSNCDKEWKCDRNNALHDRYFNDRTRHPELITCSSVSDSDGKIERLNARSCINVNKGIFRGGEVGGFT
ncbi:hypothetical protein [Microcoleus sp. herbarium14]|uniref:hypothetical protein n=1 Tax=Microcoleus sp. herbarium14 TaxID=3055439 RepID=UPI002FD2198C